MPNPPNDDLYMISKYDFEEIFLQQLTNLGSTKSRQILLVVGEREQTGQLESAF